MDGAAVDLFGCSVSVAGTRWPGRGGEGPVGGADTGSVYVYVRTGTVWTEQQALSAFDVGSNASFGFSTSISGDTVVVGARYADTGGGLDAGSAYVFVRAGTTWTQEQKLLPSDGAAGDFFGSSVSISGDTVAVGASSADTPGGFGFNTGAAYMFARAGTIWTEQQKLRPPDDPSGDVFGSSVSLSGDTLAVGVPSDDTLGAPAAGSVSVFVRSGTTWALEQKIRALDPTPVPSSLLGAVYGRRWCSGRRRRPAGGAVYVLLRLGSWCDARSRPGGRRAVRPGVAYRGTPSWWARLSAQPPRARACVRRRLARDGAATSSRPTGPGRLRPYVRSPRYRGGGGAGDDIVVPDAGSVYVFVVSGTTWTEQQKLLSDGGKANA